MNNCHDGAQVFHAIYWLDHALLTLGAKPASMRFMCGLFMALFISWFTGSAVAGDITGQMIGVLDGNTIEVLRNLHLNASD
jgi:hypothetical protein